MKLLSFKSTSNRLGLCISFILLWVVIECTTISPPSTMVTTTVTSAPNATMQPRETSSSEPTASTTKPHPPDVKEFSVVGQNETSITLQWKQVDNSTHYILRFSRREENISSSAAAVTYTVYHLTNATRYDFSLFTVFANVSSSGVTITAVTAPRNVEDLKQVGQNETSITLQWKQVNNSDYTLRLSGSEENFTLSAEVGRHTIFLLLSGHEYSFSLFTVFANVSSSGVTISAVTEPPMVLSVNVTERCLTKVTLEWANQKEDWEYILQITENNVSTIENRSSDTVSYFVSNLNPGTKYHFNVITLFRGINSTPYPDFFVTTIDCASGNWHVTNSSIQGKIEGLFSRATASNGSQDHISPSKDLSFTGLYPGATYEVSLEYEKESKSFPQCKHKLTVLPPNLKAHCEYWAGGYSARVVWSRPNGVWTTVQVNTTGKTFNIDGNEDHHIIPRLQPAKRYKVSISLLSGSERSAEPFEFFCLTDQRGVIAGSFFGVLLFLVLVCVAAFIFLKKPDIIRRKKSFTGGSKLPNTKEKAISAAKFQDHFNQLSLDENRGFSEEYEDLSSVGKNQTHRIATLPDNKAKNRFTNVLPYDWCRVKLITSAPSETLDYINASYMPGYNSNREYIATQGPLFSTVGDFWKMIWEQRVNAIVMVTNCTEGGRNKCEQYWPDDRKQCLCGELLVTTRSQQKESSWTLREFSVKHENNSEERTVKHFHFTAWPDHGVPEDTGILIQFRELIRRHIKGEGTEAPTVVHCSAGVGRTGTIIALDVLLQQLEKERAVGINAFVHKMRLNRPHMVQTESQYVFLHQCIVDTLRPHERTEENIYENADMIYVNATALRELR
ncbi:receptor-type tyrosine-protein phosphatase H-like [Odontesthes bonariensis]|uniref:receptor-type tyrosine-protein phosphatase H-like n=1 Tax=Odontesthes bonariensis TaxID=219752 RepID=UPI003F58BCBE